MRIPPRSPSSRQAGILLFECLTYLSVWFLIAGMGFAMLHRAISNWKQLTRGADDIVRTLKAGEEWRADVRAAVQSPQLSTGAEGTVQLLTVELPGGPVTWRTTATNVQRRATTDPAWREILPRIRSSTMLKDQHAGVTSWRWELELRPRVPEPLVTPVFTFQAVASARNKP